MSFTRTFKEPSGNTLWAYPRNNLADNSQRVSVTDNTGNTYSYTADETICPDWFVFQNSDIIANGGINGINTMLSIDFYSYTNLDTVLANLTTLLSRVTGLLSTKAEDTNNFNALPDSLWSHTTRGLTEDVAVEVIRNNVITDNSLASSAGTELATAVWASVARTLTAQSDSSGTTTLLNRITALIQTKAEADTTRAAIQEDIEEVNNACSTPEMRKKVFGDTGEQWLNETIDPPQQVKITFTDYP